MAGDKFLENLLKAGVIYWLYINIMGLGLNFIQTHTVVVCMWFFIIISFLSLLIALYIKKESSRDTFTLKDIRWKIGLYSLLLCISECMLVVVFYGSPVWIPKSDITFGLIISLSGAVLFAPIAEEIIFRGLIQKHLLKKLHPRLAISISAILFALIHIEIISRVLPAFLSGIFCGIIYYKTNKLIVCILFHSFYNLLAFFVGFPLNFSLLLQAISFVIATGLAVYSIRGLWNDPALNVNNISEIMNENENENYD